MNTNNTYITFNAICCLAAYFMMALSLWLAPVNLSTKGYWAMAVLLLTGSLVNLVKYRMDARIEEETVSKIQKAKNEKLLSEYVSGE